MSRRKVGRVTYPAAATVTFAMMVRAVLLLLAAIAAISATVGFSIDVGRPPVLVALIDVSPSTRGEWFRDAAVVRQEVDRITSRLAPGATVRFSMFADGDAMPFERVLVERASEKSTLPAVDADAILLFSDGRFHSPASGKTPMFPVEMTNDAQTDARLIGVETVDDQVVLTVANTGLPRTLTWPDGSTTVVPRGRIRLSHAMTADAAVARLNAGDRWSENDAIEIAPSPARASENWWIGANPPDGFRPIKPDAVPPLAAWLSARSVVINNTDAVDFDLAAMTTLAHYVRDLGGGLAIVGGDHAFSAGGYGGTAIDALSPLASFPPEPRREWLVLIDASGSMADRVADGRTRLQAAIDAASAFVAALPVSESVGVGSFAQGFERWPSLIDRRVIAPPDLAASGPTNLEAALKAITATRDDRSAALRLHVVVLSDGDADLSSFSREDSAHARQAGVVIDWLRLSESAPRGALAELVTATGGAITEAGAASHWRATAIAAAAAADRIEAAATPTAVRWRGGAFVSEPTFASMINTTWQRDGAEILATRDDGDQAGAPAVAQWRVGTGRVAAIGFAAASTTIAHIAEHVAMQPRDPRFTIRWSTEKIIVDAADAGIALNGLRLTTREVGDGGSELALDQIAPGRYEGVIATNSHSRLIELLLDGQSIDVHLKAGVLREFREIGIDRESLEALARKTGGRVIDRDGTGGAPIARPLRSRSLAVPLLLVAAAALCGALLFGSPRRYSRREDWNVRR